MVKLDFDKIEREAIAGADRIKLEREQTSALLRYFHKIYGDSLPLLEKILNESTTEDDFDPTDITNIYYMLVFGTVDFAGVPEQFNKPKFDPYTEEPRIRQEYIRKLNELKNLSKFSKINNQVERAIQTLQSL